MKIIYISLLLASVCFISFIWSVFGIFVKRGNQGAGLIWIKVVSACVFITQWVAMIMCASRNSSMHLLQDILPPIMLFISVLLFWWTAYTNIKMPLSLAYSDDEPLHIQESGPYRWIRHPYYTSYLICYFATFLVHLEFWTLPFVLIVVVTYVRAARFEENKFENSRLAQQYLMFKETRGLFWPKPWQYLVKKLV